MASQNERREATRGALLTAAVESLIETGSSGFTTADVVRRAGLSNGALFRYFPTKGDLLAATVEHIFERLRQDYTDDFRSMPAEKRTMANLLELLWRVMSDPALAAVYEVYTAARTDGWLQAAIEPVVTDHMDRLNALAHEVFDDVAGVDPGTVDQAVNLAVLAMQGLVLNLMAKPDPAAADELVTGLTGLAGVLLPSTTTPVPTRRARSARPTGGAR